VNLTHVPSDPDLVIDLDKVTYVEAVPLGQEGTVLFPAATAKAELGVSIQAGWMVYLGLGDQDVAWSGTEHADRLSARSELEAIANSVVWARSRHSGLPREKG
jgi:hypothetical protein